MMDYRLTRLDNGVYRAEMNVEDVSKDELEEVFKRIEKTKWWNDENCKDNIRGGFRNGKHKNATKHILD